MTAQKQKYLSAFEVCSKAKGYHLDLCLADIRERLDAGDRLTITSFGFRNNRMDVITIENASFIRTIVDPCQGLVASVVSLVRRYPDQIRYPGYREVDASTFYRRATDALAVSSRVVVSG